MLKGITAVSLNRAAWRRYSVYYRASFAALAVAVGLSVVQALFVVPVTWLVRLIFDRALPRQDFLLLVQAAAALLVLSLLGNVLILITRSRILRITKQAVRDFRAELLQRCYDLPRSFYDAADRGALHTAIVQDTERLDVMSNALIAQLFPAVVTAVALCGVLLVLDPILFVVLLVTAPILLLLANRILAPRTSEAAQRFHRAFEAFDSGTGFVLRMMDLTRIQAAEQLEIERQQGHLEELRVSSAATAWLEASYGMTHGVISTVSAVIILLVGGFAVSAGSMTLGQLLSFYVAVSLLNRALGIALSSVPSIIAGNESVTTLVRFIQSGENLPYSGKRAIQFQGRITVENVVFGYGSGIILDGASLTIEPRKIIAIVGENGSGKTTLGYLILGFYRPQQGRICADGVPYDELDIKALRASFAVVTQDAVLFSGTISENIAYGRPQTTDAEMVLAAKLATAHEFIRELPDGFRTRVGENGELLSGGQRQRIAIARALLRRSPLLILDEPTNHLDLQSVSQLVTNLKSLPEPPAIVLITHDLELAATADSTYLLKSAASREYGPPRH